MVLQAPVTQAAWGRATWGHGDAAALGQPPASVTSSLHRPAAPSFVFLPTFIKCDL